MKSFTRFFFIIGSHCRRMSERKKFVFCVLGSVESAAIRSRTSLPTMIANERRAGRRLVAGGLMKVEFWAVRVWCEADIAELALLLNGRERSEFAVRSLPALPAFGHEPNRINSKYIHMQYVYKKRWTNVCVWTEQFCAVLLLKVSNSREFQVVLEAEAAKCEVHNWIDVVNCGL